MILSAHRFTGFWFESESDTQRAIEGNASRFLNASLDALRRSSAGGLVAEGAINTGFDPEMFNSRLPGYHWLKDRLKWMKNRYGDRFDNQPEATNPDRRRNPFPAFFWNMLGLVDGRPLPLGGVEVLIGHDLAVVHEFAVSSQAVDDPDQAYARLNNRRFAITPQPTTDLFTASFCQVSGPDAEPLAGWSRGEFADGQCPGVQATLRCAVRGEAGRYAGCLLAGGLKGRKGDSPTGGLADRIANHVEIIGYLKFLCILLVNHAKVQYEYDVAQRATKGLKQELNNRFRQAEALARALRTSGKRPPSRATVDRLKWAHMADDKSRDKFKQLVKTCEINADQFEQVASQLMKSESQWLVRERRRLLALIQKLREIEASLRKQYWGTDERLDALSKAVSVSGGRAIAQPVVRDQIFISYSHKDARWLKELKTSLAPAVRKVGLDEAKMIWDDTLIRAGNEWKKEIREALARAKVAILLITPDFLDSAFINEVELPRLLKTHVKKNGLTLLLIHVKESLYEQTELEPIQALNDPKLPLRRIDSSKRDAHWKRICLKISEAIDDRPH
ncbi:MAG TPA: toll/interleukin-1 receptor domain-containing protein [Blastocatellia bacterium]|nr:toll/interleukin-1 receptor domain-containing protein [Blastocatellia bacterium]